VADTLGLNVSEVILWWSRTQDLSIYDQLVAGIRYLDIRLLFNPFTLRWGV
jgi:hypothetical protein